MAEVGYYLMIWYGAAEYSIEEDGIVSDLEDFVIE